MKTSSPNGPLIPLSSNFSSNFTRILKVTETIEGNSFSSPNSATPNINTVLSGGTLSNLNNPILDSQGATYAYALSHGGTTNPGGPVNAVQYNNSGAFGGTSNLLFDKLTNTLTANKISNGTVTIASGTISGLTDPITGQQAATKNYVDNSTSLLITNNNISGSTTYSAVSIINGIIYRNNQTSSTVTDILPTAAHIIAAAGADVGTVLTFGIRNTSSDYKSVVTFTAGTGITISTQQNIFSGYQYNAVIIVTNITLGSEALTIYLLGNAITNTLNWQQEIGGLTTIVKVINVTDFMPIFNTPTNLTVVHKISAGDVQNKVIYLSPTIAGGVSMNKPDGFMGVLTGSNFITGPFIWSTGGMDFYIINESATLGADLTLSGIGGTIEWTLDPNSNLTIPAGYTGWFIVALTVTNYPDVTSMTSARIYTLGIFENT